MSTDMTGNLTGDMAGEPVHDEGHDDTHASHESHESHGLTDLGYVQVAVALAIITGLEVYASYSDWLGRAFLPILLVLMVVKFFSVVLFFMHLRFDSKIFSALFYAGLFLAVGVYIVALFTFHFFDG
jgi:cytochrome c oxidase subunit IV